MICRTAWKPCAVSNPAQQSAALRSPCASIVAFLATTSVFFAIAQKAIHRHLQLNGGGTVAPIFDGAGLSPPLPPPARHNERPPCLTRGGRLRLISSCSLFYPPRTVLPVDKSHIRHCPTQSLMRLCACQAVTQPRKSGPSGKRWNGSKAVRYRTGMDWTRKRKKQEATVAAGKLKSCADQSLTAKINAG